MDLAGKSRARQLRKVVKSRLDELPTIWAAFEDALKETGAGASWLADFNLILIEGATNAVVHGHAADGRPLEVELGIGDAGVELRVLDNGNGFDLPEGEVPVPDALAESGRGIFLMKTLADEVLYLRGAEENVLVLRKSYSRDTADGD